MLKSWLIGRWVGVIEQGPNHPEMLTSISWSSLEEAKKSRPDLHKFVRIERIVEA